MIENGAERLRDDIAAIEVAMLTTVEEDNNLRSRPMYTLQMDTQGTLWFFTSKNSPKLDEIEENNHVNLSYADANSHTYISITGSAVCLDDPELKEKFWNPLHETWFPKGKEDTDLCLLKVRIKHVEIWDTETSTMLELIRVEA